jgi:hypothetical protein
VKKDWQANVRSPFYRLVRGFKLIYTSFNEKKWCNAWFFDF